MRQCVTHCACACAQGVADAQLSQAAEAALQAAREQQRLALVMKRLMTGAVVRPAWPPTPAAHRAARLAAQPTDPGWHESGK